jgi:hypothetical protein
LSPSIPEAPDEEPLDQNGATDEPTPGPTPPPRRRELIRAKSEELGEIWSQAVALDPREAFEIVVRGENIGTDGGSAAVLGTVLTRLAALIKSLGGGNAYVEHLAFANSAHIKFRPTNEDAARSEADLDAARHTDDPDTAARLYRDAVPRVHVAAALAADLIESSATEAPVHAVELGSGVAQAYKSFANAVAKNNVEVEVDPAGSESARLTPEKARRVVDTLRTVSTPQEFELVVFGILSLADAIHHEFGLRLDAQARREHPFLRGKQVIRGSVTPLVEDAIRDRGIWGKRVRATVRVRRDAVISTATVRPASYSLVDAEESAT